MELEARTITKLVEKGIPTDPTDPARRLLVAQADMMEEELKVLRKGPERLPNARVLEAMKAELPSKDLDGLTEEQKEVLGDMVLKKTLNPVMDTKATKWIMEDKAFQAAYERRRAARLKMRGFHTDARLMEVVDAGDAPSIRLMYQREGLMPIGGEYIAPPQDGLQGMSKAELEQRIKALEEKTKGQ